MSYILSAPLAAAACSAFLLLAPAAHASSSCADRTQVAEALIDRFGEALYGNAVSDSGDILEIYSNSTSETWTIVVTLPDRGLSCFVASGTGEHHLDVQLANLEG